MTARQFIHQLKESFFRNFSSVELCHYYFDPLSNTHFILIPKDIYLTSEFSAFDFRITSEAFELGIQGLICFVTDETTLEKSNSEVFYNPFNNEMLLKNLDQFIPIEEFLSLGFKMKDVQYTFSDETNSIVNNIVAESNYALAA